MPKHNQFVQWEDTWTILLSCCSFKACEWSEPVEFTACSPAEMKLLLREEGWDVAESHVGTGYDVVEGVEHWAACPACAASEEE